MNHGLFLCGQLVTVKINQTYCSHGFSFQLLIFSIRKLLIFIVVDGILFVPVPLVHSFFTPMPYIGESI